MNILIVHAHNEPQSFCAALKDLALDELSGQGHQVVVSDLYAMNWNPIASAQDFVERTNPDYLVYALEQRQGWASRHLSPDIEAEVQKLQAADCVIFNCPMYWFSVPAILKGWFDRVLLSGVCYGGKRFYDQGGLRGKKALLTMSLGGRPHMFGPDSIHGPIEDMLRPILRGTLAYTGMSVLPPFLAYHVPYISSAERQTILQNYRAYLRQLDDHPPLGFVSLADFDERLYPLRKT